MSRKDKFVCPLTQVDKRLDDVHRQWHEAENSYFYPDLFRVKSQIVIQTLRTVTFLLQNHKRLFLDFDLWYGPWQEQLRNSELMRWMVDARNKIEKQGDLEHYSYIRAELLASHLDESPRIDIPANLFTGSKDLIESIPRVGVGEHIRKQGILRIQRRWVENSLPAYELLDAIARAYGTISLVIRDAHIALGLSVPPMIESDDGEMFDVVAMEGRMPCMIGHTDERCLDIWLATGEPITYTSERRIISRERAALDSERYQISANEVKIAAKNVEEVARHIFSMARRMFEIDKEHITIAFLLRGVEIVQMIQFTPEEHGEKYVLFRRLAHDVLRRGADGVILVGEIWMAPPNPNNPYMRAAESPVKTEALAASIATKIGEPFQLLAIIKRVEDDVRLGRTETLKGGAHFQFAPIYQAWGREIPQEWLDLEQGLRIPGTGDHR